MLLHKLDQCAICEDTTWQVQSNLAHSPVLDVDWPAARLARLFSLLIGPRSLFSYPIGCWTRASVNTFNQQPILVTQLKPANQNVVLRTHVSSRPIRYQYRQWNTQAVPLAGLLVNFACRTAGFSSISIGPKRVTCQGISSLIGGLAGSARLWLVRWVVYISNVHYVQGAGRCFVFCTGRRSACSFSLVTESCTFSCCNILLLYFLLL